nr:protein HEXIM [Leptinotarsa decemlineata]
MSNLYPKLVENDEELNLGEKLPQDDVLRQDAARAPDRFGAGAKFAEGELPVKKRKTRRGKSKRRHPYLKNARKSNKLIKPEAPHNSNQFLLEDHGQIEDLDKNLMSPSAGRTRDSSFSIDSDGDFYSSPDDEEQFLIKDFDDQYESLQAVRFQTLSKGQLIEEYLILENKLEEMTKRLQKFEEDDTEDSGPELKQEIERLTIENERLRRENDVLRSKVNPSDSEDSETDSSDSCSTSSSSHTSGRSSRSRSPISTVDYSKTNGHLGPGKPVS